MEKRKNPVPCRAAKSSAPGKAAAALACLFSLAFAPALAPGLAAQEGSPLAVGGSVEEQPFLRYSSSGAVDASDFSYGSRSALGLDLNIAGERARATASFEAAVLSGAAASDSWAAKAAGLDPPDLLLVPAYDASSPVPPTLAAARVRTLYAKLDAGWVSLTAGRQVINYQRGELWSPTDLFTELDLSGLSPVRRGSDALRLVFPLGTTDAFDLVAAPTAKPSEGRYAARISGFAAGVDASAIASRDGEAGLWNAGADFKVDLVVGLNGEALVSFPDAGSPQDGPRLRAALGADYSLGDFVAAVEYYYDGGGAEADPSALGKRNGYASLTWKASEFFSLSGMAAFEPVAGDWTGTVQAVLDAAQNASLAAYAKLASAESEGTEAETGLYLVLKF